MSDEKLTWQKQAKETEEFHVNKQREKGISRPGRPIGQREGWGIRDTARELKLSVGRVCEDILLARKLRDDSSFYDIKERDDALKKLRETINET